MKNTFTLIALFILTNVLAQTPEKFSYQAVIRDANNNLLSNTSVGMQISILKTSITGTSVYTETHTTSTNSNGLISIEIGTGNTSDNFSTINWSNDTYFVKTETDPTGGTNYTITGTSQLLSVPYALHSKTATSLVVQSNTNRNYRGFTENYINGLRIYRTSINLTLNSNNSWSLTETVVLDINPDDPNHNSTLGQVSNNSGTYSENVNTLNLGTFTLNKIGNTLTLFQGGVDTFEINLTLKD